MEKVLNKLSLAPLWVVKSGRIYLGDMTYFYSVAGYDTRLWSQKANIVSINTAYDFHTTGTNMPETTNSENLFAGYSLRCLHRL